MCLFVSQFFLCLFCLVVVFVFFSFPTNFSFVLVTSDALSFSYVCDAFLFPIFFLLCFTFDTLSFLFYIYLVYFIYI